LRLKIAELVKDGKIKGIADVRDEGNERLGQRLVIVLQQSAIPKVVLKQPLQADPITGHIWRQHVGTCRWRAAHIAS
jgi:DNA gyrase/topoisomerase IV subunit A